MTKATKSKKEDLTMDQRIELLKLAIEKMQNYKVEVAYQKLLSLILLSPIQNKECR